MLALQAYGKLAPPTRAAAEVLKTQLSTGSDPPRRAAGSALAEIAGTCANDFNCSNSSFAMTGGVDGTGLLAGSGTAFGWM